MPRRSEPKLANKVKTLRLSKDGMTQQSLADEVGVTRQTIIALEAGGYTPSLALALRIAALFDVKVDDIFWIESDDLNERL